MLISQVIMLLNNREVLDDLFYTNSCLHNVLKEYQDAGSA